MESLPKKPPALQRVESALTFLLLFAVIFTFPNKPSFDLDASWRMALGKFFIDDLQFGRDVVFTYGPLGFLMGKTYSGLLFWSLISWQFIAASFIALLVRYWGQRLDAGWPRLFFYAFFVLFVFIYEDALHMLVIALIGFELLRRVGRPWHWTSGLMLLFLAVQSVAKFTNLMLAVFMVATVAILAFWQHQRGLAVRVLGWFGGAFLAGWVLCGQNLLNLPVYFRNSWYVSQGYQEVMGIATPEAPLWKALVVIGVLAAYVLLKLATQKDRPRSVASSLMLGAFLYLNWKHGFVRSDGHMVGFFYCALLPVVGYPVLLEDGAPLVGLKRWALAAAGLLCLLGIRDTLPTIVDSALSTLEGRVWGNFDQAARITSLRADYDIWLNREMNRYDMPRTRAVVGDHPLDVLGFDQAVAIYNHFNYHPRPVFQSYSAYTPELAKLNLDFYRSVRAPEYVLLKMHSIDERLPIMDDAAVFYLVTQRYKYVLTEKSFQLWVRTGAPAAPDAEPRLVERKTLALEEVWSLASHGEQPLWIRIDLRPTLLGRLRTFFYKPPMLRLAIHDSLGRITTYRMPAPIGRAGFIINPVIDDLLAFTRYASDRPDRLTHTIMLTLAAEDRKYFAPAAQVELSELKPSTAAVEFFINQNRERFFMFKSVPVSFEANNPPSHEQINTRDVMVMHAPSELIFDVPDGAAEASGLFGFLAAAYQDGNHTNGAEFVVVWSDGRETVELFRRFLNPLGKTEDRGLHEFRVDLRRFNGGRLFLRTLPGPYNDMAWDWTAWTAIEIK